MCGASGVRWGSGERVGGAGGGAARCAPGAPQVRGLRASSWAPGGAAAAWVRAGRAPPSARGPGSRRWHGMWCEWGSRGAGSGAWPRPGLCCGGRAGPRGRDSETRAERAASRRPWGRGGAGLGRGWSFRSRRGPGRPLGVGPDAWRGRVGEKVGRSGLRRLRASVPPRPTATPTPAAPQGTQTAPLAVLAAGHQGEGVSLGGRPPAWTPTRAERGSVLDEQPCASRTCPSRLSGTAEEAVPQGSNGAAATWDWVARRPRETLPSAQPSTRSNAGAPARARVPEPCHLRVPHPGPRLLTPSRSPDL